MKVTHKLTAILMALMLLVPVCGCGNVLFLGEAFQEVTCCDCCGEDEEQDEGKCACFTHGFKQYIVEKGNEKRDVSPENVVALFFERLDIHLVPHKVSFSPLSGSDPPWCLETCRWKIYCNYRL